MNVPFLISRLRTDGFPLCREAADALEKALPAITAWSNPDALRTRIVSLTQNPYSPTDSIDSPQEPLT